MAKMNRIQFQPGMSLNLFLAHYGMQWVRDVLRDARQETNRAMRYDADLAVWCAVGILRRRGKPPALPEDSERFDLCDGRGAFDTVVGPART